ncbi:hypothetical protein PanWU01x14_031930 [Parasponia andersonii]|uniref:Uncharacterized protein n=1 Tax=Parasponia andersonii TaxID=3476 RepID=A0A2P5DUA1_PARAD|nr:hypothetical protein PanWU01x14_031930 [Parasponia andersonii]
MQTGLSHPTGHNDRPQIDLFGLIDFDPLIVDLKPLFVQVLKLRRSQLALLTAYLYSGKPTAPHMLGPTGCNQDSKIIA